MGSENSVKNYNTDDSDAPYNNDVDAASNYDGESGDSNLDRSHYFRAMDLGYFVAQPLLMLNDHAPLKELCLQNNNPEAYYIEGLLQYFVHKDKHKGLRHLCLAALGNNKNGMYVYGLLMLARGHYFKGIKYLDKLEWSKKMSASDNCWESLKTSLSKIDVTIPQDYYVNMVNLAPRFGSKCKRYDMSKFCKECYYFKRTYQFVKNYTGIL